MFGYEAMKFPLYKNDTPLMLVFDVGMALCWTLAFLLAVLVFR